MKGKLGVKIITTFVVLKAKSYIYLTDDNSEDKKIKGTKKCAMKRKCEFENYRNFLEATKLDNKIKYLEKNKIDTDSIKKTMKNL